MNFYSLLCAIFLAFLFRPLCAQPAFDSLRLNQIQIIASHNSYKKRLHEKEQQFLMKYRKQLGSENDPIQLDYGHLPFDSQFSYCNVRGLELDIYADPKGGLFYKRKINAFVPGVKVASNVAVLKQPGLKMLHIKDVDFETHYYTFRDALQALKKWSDAHPNHLPIFVNIERKNDAPADQSGLLRFVGFKRAKPFDAEACNEMQAAIREVFGADLKHVITPDLVRGSYSSLDEMATQQGWPLLSECRGKVLFIAESYGDDPILKKHPGLRGSALFVFSEPGRAEAAFVKRNESRTQQEDIQQLVRKGYIIRTRTDAGTHESRNNDYSGRDHAFDSGAQIISTDYYLPDLRFSTYAVQWPLGGPGRINPVNAGNGKLDE